MCSEEVSKRPQPSQRREAAGRLVGLWGGGARCVAGWRGTERTTETVTTAQPAQTQEARGGARQFRGGKVTLGEQTVTRTEKKVPAAAPDILSAVRDPHKRGRWRKAARTREGQREGVWGGKAERAGSARLPSVSPQPATAPFTAAQPQRLATRTSEAAGQAGEQERSAWGSAAATRILSRTGPGQKACSLPPGPPAQA